MSLAPAGVELPPWELPLTPTLVVSTAIATRDFQDVHHDRDIAQAAGSKDIFMNILTTNGLCERYVTDWAGPQVQVLGIAIRLGAPAYPYDTLTFTGKVASVEDGVATIEVVGAVSLGDHVTGTVRVAAESVGRGGRASDLGGRGGRASDLGGRGGRASDRHETRHETQAAG